MTEISPAEQIFFAALAIDLPQQRAAYLDQACGEDADLRDRVERLLAAHPHVGGFLEPAPGTPADPLLVVTTEYPSSEKIGTVLAGRYTLAEKIGEGGMGEVWVAKQTEPVKRKVAIKLIKAGMDLKAVLARFEAERQALALMDHPSIAKVLDGGLTPDSRPFFVMELVKGTPITKFCDERKLTPRERLELFVPVCQAIQHAHSKGVNHRDIKPSNVLVALYDDRPVPKVIDFGVAKATGQPLTERTLDTGFGSVVGTPQYMSPEQATFNNLDIDTRSDVYSLGVLLYELLAGSPPFSKTELAKVGLMEVLRVVREDEPPRPSNKLSTADALPSLAASRGTEPRKLTGLLRDELDWVVMKALEKDRTRRYETANGFAADVQRYLSGEPVNAHPPSTGYRLRKALRKNRRPAIVAGVVLLALVGGIAGTSLGMADARRQRDAADVARQGESRERATAVTEREAADDARRNMALTLTDMHTAQGVAAGDRGEPAQAVLWFANAVRLAAGDPLREQANRVRVRTWGRRVVTPVRALAHPDQLLTHLSYHASGEYLLTQSIQNRCVVWDLAREERLQWAAGDQPVHCAAFRAVGNWLAWDAPGGEVEIRAVPGGEVLHRLPGRGQVRAVAFSADGHWLALASDVVRLWDCEAHAFAPAEYPHPAPVTQLVFSGRGDRLATGCEDLKCRVFAVPGKAGRSEPLCPPVEHRLRSEYAVAPMAPVWVDGDRGLLTLASPYGVVQWWDAGTGKLVRNASEGGRVHVVVVSPDGRRFVVGAMGWCEVWDVAAGRMTRGFSPHKHDVLAVAFAPEGETVLTGSTDRTARQWAITGDKPDERVEGDTLDHPVMVSLAAYSPDGRFLVTGQTDGLVRVWQLTVPNPGDRWIRAKVGVASSELDLDGKQILILGEKGARVYEADTGRPLGPVLKPGGPLMTQNPDWSPIGGGALSPDGQVVALLCPAPPGGTLELWDRHTGRRLAEPVPLPSEPCGVAFSRDGRLAAAISRSGDFRVADAAGRLVSAARHDPKQAPGAADPPGTFARLTHSNWNQSRILFARGGKSIITYGLDSVARVWEADTGRPRFGPLDNREISDGAAVSPDGRLIAFGSRDGQVRVWDLEDGRRVAPDLPHPDWVGMGPGAFSPDGRFLLTGGRDRAVRLWDWRAGQLVCPPFGHSAEIRSCKMSHDGRWVATASRDGTVRFWEWQTGRPVSPPIRVSGVVSFTHDDAHALVAGIGPAVAVLHTGDLTAVVDLDRDDLCTYAEVVSGYRVHESAVTILMTEEWLARWRAFRKRHPDYPTAIRFTSPPATPAVDYPLGARWVYEGTGGKKWLEKIGRNKWIEECTEWRGGTFKFIERAATSECVELEDPSRNIWLRLYEDRQEMYAPNRKAFLGSQPGAWKTQDREQLPPPRPATP